MFYIPKSEMALGRIYYKNYAEKSGYRVAQEVLVTTEAPYIYTSETGIIKRLF